MIRLIFACGLLLSFTITKAQSSNPILTKDSIIMEEVVLPAIQTALQDKVQPDWEDLTSTIKAKYGNYFSERMIIKGKIYYNYGLNWPEFTRAIVLFTEKYEDKDDLKLMNKNANFILSYSKDQSELKTAISWSKHTIEKEPGNEDYQVTYKKLLEKTK